MAAISTNAIPAAAPAPAKANGNDNNAPAGDSFAALLNAANAQAPAQPVAANDKSGTSDAAQTEDAPSSDGGTNQAPSGKTEAGPKDAAARPEAKDSKSAGDKSVNDNDPADALAQLGAQPNDPNAMAQAQIAAAQMTAPQPQPAANDDTGESQELGAVAQAGAKPGARPGAQPDTQPGAKTAGASTPADNQAAAAGKSPVAAAQAAITGTNNNGGNKDTNSGKDAEPSDKTPVKSASADAPRAEAPQPSSSAQTAQPAQPAAAAAVHAPGTPIQSNNPHPVSTSVEVAPQSAHPTPDFNALAVDIAARSHSGAKQFSIRLDPPELGRVDVRLSIDATGKTEAHLTADHPDTLNLLQKDASTLTQALRESGLDVSRDGLNFSLRSQNGQAGNEQGHQGRGSKANLAVTRVLDAAQTASSISFTGAGNGRLDIHV